MRWRFLISIWAVISVLLFPATTMVQAKDQGAVFDSIAAWQEFDAILHLRYAYIDRTDMDVEAQLNLSKSLALQTHDRLQFRKILHQTALTFSDPHFIVGPFDLDDYSIIPTGSDIDITLKSGRFIVNDVRAGSAADKAGISPGWQVIAADNAPIGQAGRLPYGNVLPNPTPRQLEYGAKLAVSGKRNTGRHLVFNTGEQQRSFYLPATYKFADLFANGPLLSTTQKGKIAIIRINNALGNNNLITVFDEAIGQVLDSDAIILDLRNTPSGGNTEVARSIIGHFVDKTQSYQIHEIPSLKREFTVPRRFIEQVLPRAPYFGGPLIVLGGHWTGSMGEGLVIGLDAAANAYTISSNMGDLLGALSNIKLEVSGAQMNFGTESLFHVNGVPRENYIADKTLERSDRDRHGNDPAMVAALKYVRSMDQASRLTR